jgi:DNA modification methylase
MARVERFLLQTFAELEAQRPPGGQEAVHFTESLATTVIEELSEEGDLVLDPFAGFGTTLVVAQRLGRRAVGVELLPERAEQMQRRLRNPDSVICGDARRLDELVDDAVGLVLTSPPYRTSNDHPEDPLAAYEVNSGTYESYLADVAAVFAQARRLLRPGGHAVVNAANVSHHGVLTPLAWDLARAIGAELTLVQDCYLAWDTQPPDISGDYLLVFRADP